MPRKKYLIINADDFGQSPGVNQGIIEAHERGIVTSASLMVHWPAALEAAEYNRAHPQLSLGLHLDLGEWFYRDGNWMPLYERVLLTESQAVSEEVSRQLALFRQLVGKSPSHLDSQQHVQLNLWAQPVPYAQQRPGADAILASPAPPAVHFSSRVEWMRRRGALLESGSPSSPGEH